jgi:hypothetical protein
MNEWRSYFISPKHTRLVTYYHTDSHRVTLRRDELPFQTFSSHPFLFSHAAERLQWSYHVISPFKFFFCVLFSPSSFHTPPSLMAQIFCLPQAAFLPEQVDIISCHHFACRTFCLSLFLSR